MSDGLSTSAAARLDCDDPLAPFAAQFHTPCNARGEPLIYLCGHSLGLQPKSAASYVEQELKEWRERAVDGHFESQRPWVSYHEQAAPGLAALTGARTTEVVAMNSLTVNLHLMLASFFRPRGRRTRIMIERGAFGSDRYAVVSQLAWHGLGETGNLIELAPRAGESVLREEDILAAIEREGERLAVVMLPGVQYLTGEAFDLPAIIGAAQGQGAIAGVDLAHAIGNLPLHLHDWNADFAVWCSYKFLNAGPGATGGCFVHERHARAFDLPRLAGWWGHDKRTRFEMGPQFDPLPGAEGWQISNPPILATAPLLASLQIFQHAGIEALRRKSIALTQALSDAIEARLRDAVQIVTPREPARRGCQLSLRIPRAAGSRRPFIERLAAHGMVGDWREPDILRLAPVPLYNSFAQCAAAADALGAALEDGSRA